MSYGIVRMGKVKMASVRGMEMHEKRLAESKSNKDIDKSKTQFNYSLFEQNGTYQEIIKKRINELPSKKKLRDNINVMLQMVVTSDEEFFKNKSIQEQQEFFKTSFDYLTDLYGKENLISANVHLDEKTPHLHINFVPVTEDDKLSMKEIYTPSNCRKLQNDMFSKVFQAYGLERGEVAEIDENGYSVKKHVTTNKLKQKTLDQLLEDNQAKESHLNALESDLNTRRLKLQEKEQSVLQRELQCKELYNSLAEIKPFAKIEVTESDYIATAKAMKLKDGSTFDDKIVQRLQQQATASKQSSRDERLRKLQLQHSDILNNKTTSNDLSL